jgi:hypothetical protein
VIPLLSLLVEVASIPPTIDNAVAAMMIRSVILKMHVMQIVSLNAFFPYKITGED